MVIKKLSRDERIDKLAWVITMAYLVLNCILSTESYGVVLLALCAIIIVFLSCVKNNGIIKFRIEQFHIQWLVFGLYAIISALWALDFNRAISQGVTIIELLLCMILMYVYYQFVEDVWVLYNAIKWAGFLIGIYTIATQGINMMLLFITNADRLYVNFANINTISMAVSFAVIIVIYEVLFRMLNWFSVFMCVPCIVVIAALGTRKALLSVLFGVALLLFLRYSSQNILKALFSIIITIVVIVVLMGFISTLPMFSGIMNRMDGVIALITGEGKVDNSTYVRSLYMKIGMEEFFKRPLFGVGIGSSGVLLSSLGERNTYFHNNFVELLCCGGIIGFAIYYSMFAYCGWKLFKYRNRDSLVKLGLSLILIFLAMDFARVTYYSKTTIFYVMVFFLHIKTLSETAEKNEFYKIT